MMQTYLSKEKEVATYFENCLQHQKNAKGVANWILNNLLAALHEKELSPEPMHKHLLLLNA